MASKLENDDGYVCLTWNWLLVFLFPLYISPTSIQITMVSFQRYCEQQRLFKKGGREHAPELSSSFVERVECILLCG